MYRIFIALILCLHLAFGGAFAAYGATPPRDNSDNSSAEGNNAFSVELVLDPVPTGLPGEKLQEIVDDLYIYAAERSSAVALAKLKMLERRYGVTPSQISNTRSGRPYYASYYRYPQVTDTNIFNARYLGLNLEGGTGDFRRTLDFLTGSRAVDESLQVGSIGRQATGNRSVRNVPIGEIEHVDIESHPWADMINELDREIDEPSTLFDLVPRDHFVVYFEDIDHFDNLTASIQELLPFGERFVGLRDFVDIEEEIQNRLGIEDLAAFKDAVTEIAFVSEDLEFLAGTQYALIMNVDDDTMKNSARLFSLGSNQKGVMGDYFVAATSPALFSRIKNSESRGALANAEDFRYMRAVLDAQRHGLVYLSEDFIRKLTGPAYRINAARRNGVMEELVDLQYIVFGYRAITGRWPSTFSTIAEEGYAQSSSARDYDRDYVIGDDGWVSHKHWGSLQDLKSVEEVPITHVTEDEKRQYDRFNRGYQSFFRLFFDPVGVAIWVGDRIMFNTIILPLIDESSYNDAKTMVGDTPMEFDVLGGSLRIPPVLFASGFDFENILYTMDDARGRSLDAAVRAHLNNMRAHAELYYDDHGNTYADACSDPNIQRVIESVADLSEFGTICRDRADSWVFAAELPETKAVYCVDSKGRVGNFSRLPEGYECEEENRVASSELERRSREGVPDEERRRRINTELNEDFNLNEDDPIDFFGLVGDELHVGVGESLPHEVNNIADYDVYVGVELQDVERMKRLMNTLFSSFARQVGGLRSGFFSLSTTEPLKNSYQGVDYYLIPTGFINLYYLFHGNFVYFAPSQLAVNNIIDNITATSTASMTDLQEKIIADIGAEHNMLFVADVRDFDRYREQLAQSLFDNLYQAQRVVLNTYGYLSDYQIMRHSLGTEEAAGEFFKHRPDYVLNLKVDIGEDDVFVSGVKRAAIRAIDFVDNTRPWIGYRSRRGADVEPTVAERIKFNELYDDAMTEELAQRWKAFEGLGIGLRFTEDGLETKLAIENPLDVDAERTARERDEEDALMIYILAALAVIALAAIAVVLIKKNNAPHDGNSTKSNVSSSENQNDAQKPPSA